MLFAAAGLLLIAFLALAFVGITEARTGVRRLEQDIEQSNVTQEAFAFQGGFAETEISAARFSSSLLALSKAQLQARHNSPEPVHVESSSSALAPRPQSKTPAPVS